MKSIKFTFLALAVGFTTTVHAQNSVTVPDLDKVENKDLWNLYNREINVTGDGSVHLTGKPGDGLLWIRNYVFGDGTIECEIKGQDIQGRSFVGIAFHGLNDSTFDAVYFRPFNFKNKERNGHSVQYISHPEYTWDKLREEHPGEYENRLSHVPEPDDWFHVRISIEYPNVEVFVDNSDEPSLSIEQLGSQKKGWIGFWVGNNSEGDFKNLRIISK